MWATTAAILTTAQSLQRSDIDRESELFDGNQPPAEWLHTTTL